MLIVVESQVQSSISCADESVGVTFMGAVAVSNDFFVSGHGFLNGSIARLRTSLLVSWERNLWRGLGGFGREIAS